MRHTQPSAQMPRNVIVMYADGAAATQFELGRYSSEALRNQPTPSPTRC